MKLMAVLRLCLLYFCRTSAETTTFPPWNVCKIYSFFLCHTHTSHHTLTRIHLLIRNCTLTPSRLNLMPQFFGYYFNVFAHRNGETFWIFSSTHMCGEMLARRRPGIFTACVTFFSYVYSTLGTFFGRWIGNRSYVFASSSPSPHSLTQ